MSDLKRSAKMNNLKITIWPFFAALPVSLLMALALTPRHGGEVEYLIAYLFFMICASGCLVAGNKKQKRSYVYSSFILVFASPLLPIFALVIYDSLFRHKI
jgi:hypothetical protein